MAVSHLIVFDLDGTLVDSRRDLADSANELLASYGATALDVDEVERMVGEGARVLVERVLAARRVPAPHTEALGRFLEIYAGRLVVDTRPYPGIVPLLSELQGRAHLAVLTNKPSRHTALMLDSLGLGPYFFAALGADEGFARKPDPAALAHLMVAAGVSPEATLMVGDSMVDVETARRAGTHRCFVQYGYGRFDAASPPPDGREQQAVDVRALREIVLGFLSDSARVMGPRRGG